jgi:hypothetical protein
MPNRQVRKLYARLLKRVRFEGSLRYPENCWTWTGSRTADGYGKTTVCGRNAYVHRIMMVLGWAEDPGGLEVTHKCNSPPCCNPTHLAVGSHRDNMRHMSISGRASSGESHWNAQLTDKQVAEIRFAYRAGTTQYKLADLHGTTQGHVGKIVRGEARTGAGGPVKGVDY